MSILKYNWLEYERLASAGNTDSAQLRIAKVAYHKGVQDTVLMVLVSICETIKDGVIDVFAEISNG